MRMPIDCPFCNGPLCSTFDHLDTQHKVCDKKLNHNVEFIGNFFAPDYCIAVRVKTKPKVYIEWDFRLNFVEIVDESGSTRKRTRLPFFEPDLSNYPKLLNKVRKYLLFS